MVLLPVHFCSLVRRLEILRRWGELSTLRLPGCAAAAARSAARTADRLDDRGDVAVRAAGANGRAGPAPHCGRAVGRGGDGEAHHARPRGRPLLVVARSPWRETGGCSQGTGLACMIHGPSGAEVVLGAPACSRQARAAQMPALPGLGPPREEARLGALDQPAPLGCARSGY